MRGEYSNRDEPKFDPGEPDPDNLDSEYYEPEHWERDALANLGLSEADFR